ncbi:hypothetical protein N7462_005400 [Penicillium macrosclerotiorum]|uniref:uncharacterized protein n=1 Tax=Penicillium macrosclerotiorum TaxID=303699 RepID=UPI0025482E54|nr:uncharacterized protein N7462_005400 [Penicillium macrosclerotiorum]KAJ5682235.1 hypothetical protein N7462_005400 [Penicillium macrosclerotiorum]
MKVIIAGATGLVGSELIRQSLEMREISEVVALARKPVQVDSGVNTSKLRIVVIADYGEYSEDVMAEFAGADACIWTVAVTPFRTGGFDFAEVKRVCQECTLLGFEAIYRAGPSRPFRFLYFSAEGTSQGPAEESSAWFMRDYQIMRGETEMMVQKLPTKFTNVEVAIARPGVVTNNTTFLRSVLASLFDLTNIFTRALPNVSRRELVAAVLSQVVYGFDQEILSNADLVRIGQTSLAGNRAA